jgi:hypothetical protein
MALALLWLCNQCLESCGGDVILLKRYFRIILKYFERLIAFSIRMMFLKTSGTPLQAQALLQKFAWVLT